MCACVRLNVCFRTSCWEKTGGLLFSSCTVTTTVQELFRPARDIIIPSVSDSGSAHHANKVCWRNGKYLIFTPRSMSHADHIICHPQRLAWLHPLDANVATKLLTHYLTKLISHVTSGHSNCFIFVSCLSLLSVLSPSLSPLDLHLKGNGLTTTCGLIATYFFINTVIGQIISP